MDTELKLNTRNIQHRLNTRTMYRFDLNSYLFFYFFRSTYLRCLRCHYPAITPKCIIRTWSIGVKCLISTRNMVFSHVIWNHKWSEKCSRSDLRGSKIKNFSGGVCPQTPLEGALPHTVPLPPKIFSKYHFPPLL